MSQHNVGFMRRNDFTHFYALEKKGTGHCFTHTHGAKFLNPARFKARVPGFDRVGRVNFYFKKFQKDVVLVKKKKTKVNGLQPGFWPGQPGHTGSWLMLFFHQPGPVPAPGQPGPGSTRRAGPGFKTLMRSLLKNHLQWCVDTSTTNRMIEFISHHHC